jgi:hypothetical protein
MRYEEALAAERYELDLEHKERLEESAKLRRAQHLLSIDLGVLAALSAGVPEGQTREATRTKVLEIYLEKAIELYADDACRACLFRRNNETDLLEVWAHFGFGDAPLPRSHYHTADNYNGPRGVAAYTYKTHNLQVIQIVKVRGQWLGYEVVSGLRHPDYLPTSIGTDMDEPRYRSFITAAVLDAEGNCIAVLDIDSTKEDTFVDEEDKLFVKTLAASIGSALLILEKLAE